MLNKLFMLIGFAVCLAVSFFFGLRQGAASDKCEILIPLTIPIN